MTAMEEKLSAVARKQAPGCRRIEGRRYTGYMTPERREIDQRSERKKKARGRA